MAIASGQATDYPATSVLGADFEDAYSHFVRGFTLSKQNRFDEALEAFNRALNLMGQKNDVSRRAKLEILCARGVALQDLALPEEALLAVLRASRGAITKANAHLQMAAAFIALERYENCLVAADRAIFLKPTSSDAHLMRALALTGLQRKEQAAESDDRAIENGDS